MTMIETVGFIGLGDLGRPVAANLLDAGYPLVVYNRTASKADDLVARGAARATRAADAAKPGGIVCSLLWDDASVNSVVHSEGFLDRLGAGGVHVSMSTITPACSKALAAIYAEHGSHFVEAPIFGRPDAAVAKQLWIPYAGPQEAKARVKPLFEAMGAQGTFDFGVEIGAATTVKLVGNFLIISAGGALIEGLSLVEKLGFDPVATIDMLTSTLFPAPIYKGYGRMIAEHRTPPSGSPIPEKDLSLFKVTAQTVEAPTPISSLLLELRRAQP